MNSSNLSHTSSLIDYYQKYNIYKKKYQKQKLKLNFLNWFKNNGGYQNLKLIKTKDGNETIANHDIKKNDILVSVPIEIMITVFNGKGDSFINDLTKKLLDEKDKDSFKEYIKFLPEEFDFMVYNWDNTSFEVIKNTSVYPHAIQNKNNYNRRFNQYKMKYGKIPEEDYNWAYSCCVTRNFSVYRDNIKYNCFVPYADLLNHSNTNNTVWYFDNIDNKFKIKAIENINKGEKVTTTYGFLDGKKSINWYGFFYDKYHTIDLGNLHINQNLKTVPKAYQSLINDKIIQLETDINKYNDLGDKYKVPLKILSKEYNMLKSIKY